MNKWRGVYTPNLLPVKKNASDHYARILEKLASIKTTRRGLFQGVVGVSAGLPLVGSIASAATRFTTSEDPYGLTISIADLPVWRLDTRWFDGNPRLSVRFSTDALRVELRNALFPGTQLPADLILKAHRSGTDWHARFQLEGVNLDAETRFQHWLLGLEGATSDIRVPALFLQCTDGLRLTDVKGAASFRADWVLASSQLDSGSMVVGDQRADVDGFHLELDTSAQNDLMAQPISRNWISLAQGSELRFDLQPALLQIGSSPSKGYIEAQRDSALILIQAKPTSSGLHSAAVSWQGETQVKLPVKDAVSRMEFLAGNATISGAWKLETGWHMLDGMAVEFDDTLVPEKILLASAEPVPVEMKSSPPKANRFVVSLPGCDLAMFQLRAGGGGSSSVQFADALSFAYKRIPLDCYDLTLRRASDGLFCSVRFRGVELVHSPFRGWGLEPTEQKTSVEKTLIEFDLGSQHLLEEAEYVTEWCGNLGQPRHQFPVPDEIAALDIRKRAIGGEPMPEGLVVPVNIKKITLNDLIVALQPQPKFDDFKKDLANKKSKVGFKGRFEAAGATHLLFELVRESGKASLPFSMEALFSWSDDGSNRPKQFGKSRLIPVLPKRAVAVVNLEDTDSGVITRPLRLDEDQTGNATYETGIEAPARLIMSPIPVLRGDKEELPVWQSTPILPSASIPLPGRRVELWNVRLTGAKVRAVFSPDVKSKGNGNANEITVDVFDPPNPYDPQKDVSEFRTSLDKRDRHELIALTALSFEALCGSKQVQCKPNQFVCKPGDKQKGKGRYLPVPIDAELLLLSSQGANFKYRGFWDPPSHPDSKGGLSVKRYDHRAQMGRDVLACVEYKGYLFPIGIPAVLVKLTERRFCMEGKQSIAKLVQRFYIQVSRFTRAFPAIGQPYEGRLWGHAAIAMENFTTPDLDDPATNALFKKFGSTVFYPRVSGKNVLFEFYEPEGDARYSAPLVFVDNNVAHNSKKIFEVVNKWRTDIKKYLDNKSDHQAWRNSLNPLEVGEEKAYYGFGFADVKSARLSYVAGERSENTDIETKRVILGVNIPIADPTCSEQSAGNKFNDLYGDTKIPPEAYERLKFTTRMEAENQPPFYPVRRRALIASTQIAVLTGQSSSNYLIDYDPVYRDAGFSPGQNAAQIFGIFAGEGPLMSFGNDTSRSGGFASPSARIVWLSRQRGLIGGPAASVVAVSTATLKSTSIPKATENKDAEVKDHPDEFNPKEYFGAVLGDAKLLGVVRLVDVLDAVLKATGTEMPTIKRQNLFDLPLKLLGALLPQIDEKVKSLVGWMDSAGKDPSTAAAAARLRPGLNRFMAAVEELRAVIQSPTKPSDVAVLASGNKLAAAATALAADVRALVNDPVVLLPEPAKELIRIAEPVLTDLKKLLPPEKLFEELKDFANEVASRALEEQIAVVLADLANSPAYGQISAALMRLRTSIAEFRNAAINSEASLEALRTGVLSRLKYSADDALMQLDLANQVVGNACATASVPLEALKALVLAQLDRVPNIEEFEKIQQRTNAWLSGLQYQIDDVPRKIGAVQAGSSNEQALTRARNGMSTLSGSLNSQVDSLHRLMLAKSSLTEWLKGGSLCRPPSGGRDDVEELYRRVSDAVEITLLQPERALRMVMQLAETAEALLALDQPKNNILAVGTPPVSNELGGALSALVLGLDSLIPRLTVDTKNDLKTLKNKLEPYKENNSLVEQQVAYLDKSITALVELDNKLAEIKDSAVWNKAREEFISLIQEKYQNANAYLKDVDRVAAIFVQMARSTSPEALVNDARGEVRRRLNEIESDLRATFDEKILTPVIGRVVKAFCTPAKGLIEPDDKLVKLQSSYLSNEANAAIEALRKSITDCSPTQTADKQIKSLEGFVASLSAFATLLGRSVSTGNIGQLVNAERVMEEIVAQLGVPTSIRISYDWDTQVESYPKGGGAIFEPLKDRRLAISAVIDASLRGGQPTATMEARLSPFAIHLFGKEGASNFLSIEFSELKMKLRPGQGIECHTDVTSVKPGSALGFVNKLSDVFGGRSGFRLLPGPRGIRVGYEYAKAFDVLGGFILQNIAFSIYADLPFDNSKVRFSMQLADKIKPFLISAGIYGGGGFLSIRTCADTLEVLEASFEYGAMVAFAYGPAAGAGRVTAGIYIRMGGRDPVIQGFFCAAGEVSIAGLINMGAMLRVTLSYSLNTGKTSGSAIYTFKFSIGFVDFSYSAQVDYARDGDKDGANSTARTDGGQAILLANADTGTRTDVTPGLLASSIGKEKKGQGRTRPVDSSLDLGLLQPELWKRYWAAFSPTADVPTDWLSFWHGQKEQGATLPKSLADSDILKQIQWYVVPWGFAGKSLRLSLRIMPTLAWRKEELEKLEKGNANDVKLARKNWPKFLASIKGASIQPKIDDCANLGEPAHVKLGDAYKTQLTRMGLTVEQASQIWAQVFPDSLITPTVPPQERTSDLADSIKEYKLHCSASLADRSEKRAGLIFANALGGFNKNTIATFAEDGYVTLSTPSKTASEILISTAAIIAPITLARRVESVTSKHQDSSLESWIKRTVTGRSADSKKMRGDGERPLYSPYSKAALDYLENLPMQLSPNSTSLVDQSLDEFARLFLERHAAYATELPGTECQESSKAENFHDRLAGLATHPWLLKVLGLVIDMEIEIGDPEKTKGIVLEGWQLGDKTVVPTTKYCTKLTELGLPKSKPNDDKSQDGKYKSGLLNLSVERDEFKLTQVDVDRTPERFLQMAVTYQNEVLSGRRPSEIVVGLQPQETVGLSLIEKRRNDKVRRQLLSNPDNKEYKDVYLENLVLGYRADVRPLIPNQDSLGARARDWTSLCARKIRKVTLNGSDVTDWFAKIGIDESILVERSRTPKVKKEDGKDGYMPGNEHFLEGERFRWGTWVLGVPSPDVEGARTSNSVSCKAGASVGLQIEYDAVPGATPQRIGHGYRVGMRLVMMDGNSVPLNEAANEGYRENAGHDKESYSLGDEFKVGDFGFAPFLRYEPLLPPTLLLIDRPEREKFSSENARKVIVASGGDGAPSRKSTNRVLVPPRCASVDLAIRHGAFDNPDFQNAPPPSAFENIVLTERGDFPSWSYAYLGLPGSKGTTEELYFNRLGAGTRAPKIPYYPDPWAQRLVLGFYRAGDNRLMYVDYFEYYDKDHVWPNCRELHLEVQSVDSVNDPVLGFEVGCIDRNKLTVKLARGAHIILRTWHEMDVEKLNQSAIVDQMVCAVFDTKSGTELRDNLKKSKTAGKAEVRQAIIEQLSRWQELRGWDDQTARPSCRVSRLLNLTSFWMLNPFQDLELLHAIAKPMRPAELSEGIKELGDKPVVAQVPARMSGIEIPFKIVRRPGETSAVFRGHVRLNRASTRGVDALAEWSDNASKATLNQKTGSQDVKTESRKGLLFSLREIVEVAMDDSGAPALRPLKPELDAYQHLQCLHASVPVSDARPNETRPVTSPYDFGDTRARVIDVELQTHARHANEFASVDKSIHTITSPRKRVVVPGTERPQPPKVEYVVPLYQWVDGSTSSRGVRRTREAGWFRIWLGNEWYSSGNGELLALVCWPGDLLDPAERRLLLSRTRNMRYFFEEPNELPTVEPHITRWGLDPLMFETGEFGNMPASALKNRLRNYEQLSRGEFPRNAAFNADLHHLQDVPTFEPQFNLGWLPDVPTENESDKQKVVLALYRPICDPSSGRWYADIQIDPLYAYQPFVRLALARYQPHALQDITDEDKAKHYSLRLSSVVSTEFIQLLPERSVTMIPRWKSGDAKKTIDIVVAGTTLRQKNTECDSKSVLNARVEEQLGQKEGEQINGAWVPVVTQGQATSNLEYIERDSVWRTKIEFEHKLGREYSLVIEEYEMLNNGKDRRVKLVYFDRIPIRVDGG